MSNYAFPTDSATCFQYGPWKIGLWMDSTAIGDLLLLGYDDPGSGWTDVGQPIMGPMDSGAWSSAVADAGGMGNLIVSQFPKINAALEKYFNTHPALPVESNATPYSRDDFNAMLAEYIGFLAPAGVTHPSVTVHPYSP